MPRPILYNTPKEKSAANRAKSTRHYERNKALISAKRSVTYRDQRKRSEFNLPVATSSVTCRTRNCGDHADTAALTPTGLSYWCGRVERVEVRLRKLLGGNPHSYIDAICKSYLTSRSKDDIRDKILAFTPMQKSIVRYEDEILGLAGVGKEWTRAHEVSKLVGGAVQCLEDLLCSAMLGYDEVVCLYEKEQLKYQLEYL